MFVPSIMLTAKQITPNCVISVNDELVLVVAVEDHPANNRVASAGTTTITYTDTDSITSRSDSVTVDRHRPIMNHVWSHTR